MKRNLTFQGFAKPRVQRLVRRLIMSNDYHHSGALLPDRGMNRNETRSSSSVKEERERERKEKREEEEKIIAR